MFASIFPHHVDPERTEVLLLGGVWLAGKEGNHATAQEDFQRKLTAAHRGTSERWLINPRQWHKLGVASPLLSVRVHSGDRCFLSVPPSTAVGEGGVIAVQYGGCTCLHLAWNEPPGSRGDRDRSSRYAHGSTHGHEPRGNSDFLSSSPQNHTISHWKLLDRNHSNLQRCS